MVGTNHLSRKFIATMPLLLIGGIIAQAILLVAVIVLYVPCLLFPGILNGTYRTITKATARLFAQSIIGRSRPPKAGMVTLPEK